MFAPRMSKTDLVKRQSDILSNYYSRYIEPNQNYKRAKEVRKKRRDLSEII